MTATTQLTPVERAIRRILLSCLDLSTRGFAYYYQQGSLYDLSVKSGNMSEDQQTVRAALGILLGDGLLTTRSVGPILGLPYWKDELTLEPKGLALAQRYKLEDEEAARRGSLGFRH